MTDTSKVVLRANNDNLALTRLGGGTATTSLEMDRGTSPAIAALPGGGWVTAFQDNANQPYVYDSSGHKINTGLGMDPGTGPAVAVAPSGSYRVVFQANDHVLAGYNSSDSNYTTTAGRKAGTSPVIAAEADGTYEAAMEANTSSLATIHLGTGHTVNTTTLGMDTGTSPDQLRRLVIRGSHSESSTAATAAAYPHRRPHPAGRRPLARHNDAADTRAAI